MNKPCTPNDYAAAIAAYFNRDMSAQDLYGMIWIGLFILLSIYLLWRKTP